MVALAIAPFLEPVMTVPQNSGLFEGIGTSIVQFAEADSATDGTTVLTYLTRPPEIPVAAIATLQELIQLLRQLRSPHEQPSAVHPFTPEELVPYVMEEALDVLEALQMETSRLIHPARPSPLIQLDSLVSPLLWAIARSAYPVMELLEGMRGCVGQPGHPWMPGVLRLVPLLELSTPSQYWRFDLTTGRKPQNLIHPDLQIQLEKAPLLDLSTIQETDPASIYSASQQLQSLADNLSSCDLTLQALFQGVSANLLFPNSSWVSGELRLSLNLEFVAQEIADFVPAIPLAQNHCVEAELMEGLEPEKTGTFATVRPSVTVPLSVIEMPVSLPEPATLIRIAEQPLLDHLTQAARQQVMATAIAQMNTVIQSPGSIDPVLAVIRTANSLERWVDQFMQQNFSLLQPELLLDELVPKLLWQLSRSSCAIMQWIGGMPIELLQPDRAWEIGILRLMFVLALSTRDRTWHIDLATGRFIPNHSWQLNPDAVAVVPSDAPALSGMPAQNPHPLRIGTLLEQLLLPIQTNALDIAVLQDAIAVEWLTSEQEWQPGQLALHWGFTWMPDIC